MSLGAEVVSYDLNDGVKGCQGCLYCRSHDGCCALNDALLPVFEEYRDADGVVIGFPIYFGNVSGQGKIWLDRMWPLIGCDRKPCFPGLKCVAVYAQGNPNPDAYSSAISANNAAIQSLGMEIVDSILNYDNKAADYRLPDELLDRAFLAGQRLVR